MNIDKITIDKEIKEFLNEKAVQYNNPNFIETDPISIPHSYTLKEDIEISGFLIATIAWGNRKMIIKNGFRMMELMGNNPFEFVMDHKEFQLERLKSFVHRTFNGEDLVFFIKSLKNIYLNHGGLESIFNKYVTESSTQNAIHELKKVFFSINHPGRTTKHISDPAKGSAAKRINMYLRWLVRNDKNGVDFGLWKKISPSTLSCPLDIHTGNIARKLGFIERKQNDAKALKQLDMHLRMMNSNDPVIYDYALFGLGVFEGF